MLQYKEEEKSLLDFSSSLIFAFLKCLKRRDSSLQNISASSDTFVYNNQ